MSYIRIIRPGYPVNPADFIDLGPSVGRIHYGAHGVPIVSGAFMVGWRVPHRFPGTEARIEPVPRAVCGYLMPLAGEHCARRAGHKPDDHRTAYAVGQERARRASYRKAS